MKQNLKKVLKGNSKIFYFLLSNLWLILEKFSMTFKIYNSFLKQNTLSSNLKYIWHLLLLKNLKKNSFWCKNLKKGFQWKVLDSFLFIAPLCMGGLAMLFITIVTVEELQLHYLHRSQVKDSEVLLAQLGTKWVDRRRIIMHFCFL